MLFLFHFICITTGLYLLTKALDSARTLETQFEVYDWFLAFCLWLVVYILLCSINSSH